MYCIKDVEDNGSNHWAAKEGRRVGGLEGCRRGGLAYLRLVGNGGMGYNYTYYYYHSSIPYQPKVGWRVGGVGGLEGWSRFGDRWERWRLAVHTLRVQVPNNHILS